MKKLILLSLIFLSACATNQTIRDVPTIQSENIKVPTFKGLPKRTVALNVLDRRSEGMKGNTNVVVAEVDRALSEALRSHDIAVSGTGTNELTLTITNEKLGKFNPGCVRMEASMLIPKRARLNAESSSCFETKTPFGKQIGADITKSYEEALTLILLNLDQALQKASYL